MPKVVCPFVLQTLEGTTVLFPHAFSDFCIAACAIAVHISGCLCLSAQHCNVVVAPSCIILSHLTHHVSCLQVLRWLLVQSVLLFPP